MNKFPHTHFPMGGIAARTYAKAILRSSATISIIETVSSPFAEMGGFAVFTVKKTMFCLTAGSLICALFCQILYSQVGIPVLYSLMITFGTIFYHLGMRLAVGAAVHAKFHNQMDYKARWFKVSASERRFYDAIRVKKWKNRMPTYTPENFRINRDSVQNVIQAACQAEIVHEINMVLSFIPLPFSIWLGDFAVFAITSCLACIFDGMFVVIQRFNRPRLMRLIK